MNKVSLSLNVSRIRYDRLIAVHLSILDTYLLDSLSFIVDIL